MAILNAIFSAVMVVYVIKESETTNVLGLTIYAIVEIILAG